ncbi:AAA family ATPase [Agathobaculum massiliense]|uniref:AAA family ATPase n=1 Tax=Agathobaculum massiliense TaxID=3014267 RepID=UPI000D1EA49D|nr:MoxR family ATPase [Agathobaculum massiliense]
MEISAFAAKLAAETEKIILGKHDRIELIIAVLLAGGHILLDDMPGVGKTTLVKTLSLASGCASRRVQFVPDLLPSDITGMNIFDQRTGEFRLLRGPVFTHILLADEINRAVPRTQSALLEAMEEQHVTIDGETLPLPAPFFVLATQNPVESESTFRLPAAQMDRFLMRLSMGYPDAAEEAQMLRNLGDAMPFDQVRAVTGPEEILALRASLQNIQVSDAVTEYIVALVAATRGCPGVAMGASPRASRALFRVAKAWAAMRGRAFVTPDDVQYLARFVLPHRLLLESEAQLAGRTGETVVAELLESVPVPPAQSGIYDE